MNKSTSISILAILIIQLVYTFTIEARLRAIEKQIDNYFAPCNDVQLPIWEEEQQEAPNPIIQ